MKPSLTRRLALCIALALPFSAAAAERIVSIGGDVTEIAFALGAGDEVIARDSTSLQPEAVKKLPDVGYMRQLNAEGILALKPSLVLTTELPNRRWCSNSWKKAALRSYAFRAIPRCKACRRKSR
jgi:iron complex transport system substrate-binding protein